MAEAGLREFQRDLNKMLRGVQSNRAKKAILNVAHRGLMVHAQRMFRSGGAIGAHGRWPRYSPAEAKWEAWKKSVGGGDKPLVWPVGDLEHSLTREHHSQHIGRIRGDRLTFGTTHPGAQRRRLDPRWQRRGHGRDIPERRVIDLTRAQAKEIGDAMFREFVKQLDREARKTAGIRKATL